MNKDQGMLAQLMEIRRLMQRTGMSLEDALGLLTDQLRYFEEVERLGEEIKHAPYPAWVYEQDVYLNV